jgi:hypothetical protein
VVSKIPAFWSICHSVITKTFTFPPWSLSCDTIPPCSNWKTSTWHWD